MSGWRRDGRTESESSIKNQMFAQQIRELLYYGLILRTDIVVGRTAGSTSNLPDYLLHITEKGQRAISNYEFMRERNTKKPKLLGALKRSSPMLGRQINHNGESLD